MSTGNQEVFQVCKKNFRVNIKSTISPHSFLDSVNNQFLQKEKLNTKIFFTLIYNASKHASFFDEW